MRDDFAIFVLTHGRADRMKTARALAQFKFTGKWFVVIDDEDAQGDTYRTRYGERVLLFSKAEVAKEFDLGDNFPGRKTPIFARNACWALAKKIGVRYFMQMDDDYSGFYIRFNRAKQYGTHRAECLDEALSAMVDYLAATPALSIAMSQGGDHIGGAERMDMQKRKAMNTFLCDVERPFRFFSRLNDDVSTYVELGRKGELFLTIPSIQVNQAATQSQPGGLTEAYLDAGTYVKSFYSVMYTPSAVKIGALFDGRSNVEARVHHKIDWHAMTAQIVPEQYRKAS